MTTLTLTSSGFAAGQAIPRRFTGEGENVSPALTWANPPPGTKELALVVDDPDAPTDQPFVHWVIYKIPPQTTGLPEGVPPTDAGPGGALQGTNDFHKLGWYGPMPPRGHGVHHYHFKLYALDQPLQAHKGWTKAQLLQAMQGHILATGELVGSYQR